MQVKCHCGQVQVTVPQAPKAVTSCNCSVCHRYGALWGNYPPEQVQVEAAVPQQSYLRGEGLVEFKRCGDCGCVTHYVTTAKVTEDPTVGVNFRMATPAELTGIKVRYFEGADTWRFLDEPSG